MNDAAGQAAARFEVHFASLSQPGGRDYNEDSWGRSEDDGHLVCVVADGAGGHGGGDIASKLAVEHVISQAQAAPLQRGEEVEDLLRDTNARILFEQRAMGGAAEHMHSTVVALFIDLARAEALWGHARDSRLYLFREGKLVLHTRDHSVVQGMVDSGMISAAESRTHKLRSQLVSALGVEQAALQVDASAAPWPIADGDVFLMCSDGLWEYVEDGELTAALGAAQDPAAWLGELDARVRHAAQAAGRARHDNYTALGLWVRQATSDLPGGY